MCIHFLFHHPVGVQPWPHCSFARHLVRKMVIPHLLVTISTVQSTRFKLDLQGSHGVMMNYPTQTKKHYRQRKRCSTLKISVNNICPTLIDFSPSNPQKSKGFQLNCSPDLTWAKSIYLIPKPEFFGIFLGTKIPLLFNHLPEIRWQQPGGLVQHPSDPNTSESNCSACDRNPAPGGWLGTGSRWKMGMCFFWKTCKLDWGWQQKVGSQSSVYI